MTVGDRIRTRRKQLGLSVDELADLLGKNRATIYRYESSEIEKLPTTVLEPLAKALNTTPSYLMGWQDEDNVFGDIIKSRRIELGLTIEDLAQKTGLSVESINKYENNQRKPSDSIIGYFREALLIDIPIRAHKGYWDFREDIDIELNEKLALLNDTGKKKALDYIKDLSEQSKYLFDPNEKEDCG